LLRTVEQGSQIVEVVAGDANAPRLSAGECDLRGETVAVGVADLVRLRSAGNFHQLVACGEDGDPGTREDLNAGDTDGGEGGDVGSGEARAGGDDWIAGAGFAAGGHDVAAGAELAAVVEADAVPRNLHMFEHDHGVRAFRHGCASHDLECAAGFECCGARRFASPKDSGHGQPVASSQRGGADSVAVASGAVEGREIAVGTDRRREGAVRGIEERKLLGLSWCCGDESPPLIENQRGGFGVGEDGGHVIFIVRLAPIEIPIVIGCKI
jgi:hypothetical protein